MKVQINLKGWADGLSGYRKMEFPLQIAMYEIIHDCDFQFEIKSEGTTGYVYDAFKIDVIATRCCSRYYEEGKPMTETIEKYVFSFIVPEYTKAYVYSEAKKCLKEGKYTKTKELRKTDKE